MTEFKDSDCPEMGSRIFFGFSGVFAEVDAGFMCYPYEDAGCGGYKCDAAKGDGIVLSLS